MGGVCWGSPPCAEGHPLISSGPSCVKTHAGGQGALDAYADKKIEERCTNDQLTAIIYEALDIYADEKLEEAAKYIENRYMNSSYKLVEISRKTFKKTPTSRHLYAEAIRALRSKP